MNIISKEDSVKRTSKDSVFQMLFSEKRYQKELMEALEPQLGDINEELLHDVTLENAFLNKPYNDLGLEYEGRIIVLVESQSLYSKNIALRQLLYLSETLKDYMFRKQLTVHQTRMLDFPEVGLYAICINKSKDSPEYVSFELNHNGDLTLFCKVKLIYLSQSNNVVSQYLHYCNRFDKMYREGKKNIKNLLDQCINDGILSDFFSEHYKELISMEDILFGDYAVKIMNETLEKKVAESEKQAAESKKQAVESEKKAAEFEKKATEFEKKNLELELEIRELKETAKVQIEQCNVRIAELEQVVRKLSKNN